MIGIIKSNISVILPSTPRNDHITPAVVFLVHPIILIPQTSTINPVLVKSLELPAEYA